MPRRSPYGIDLSDGERDVLESLARSYTLPYWRVVRAQMVLLAADGLRNDQIAARLNCRREVVSQWRKRFFEPRRGRSSRPARRCSKNSLRHCETTSRRQFKRAAIWSLRRPSAANSTIWARTTRQYGNVYERANDSSTSRSPSLRSIP